MEDHLLIIKVLGQWWRMNINVYKDVEPTHFGPLGVPPTMPSQLIQMADEIYNLSTRTTLKSRSMNQSTTDAAIMRMWLDGGLPELEYESHSSFRYRADMYYKELA